MLDATGAPAFGPPDLSVFCRLDELGLVVTGQRFNADCAELSCRVVGSDRWCRRCGAEGRPRDTVTRRLAHEPFGWRPTTLIVTVRRYACSGCGHVSRQDMTVAAEPGAKLTRRALGWALHALVVGDLTVACIAEALGVSWNTANTAVLDEGRRRLISDPGRFDGVRVLGVDEHVWRHTRAGDKYVTVIIDLTPVADRSGPARLLDMARSNSPVLQRPVELAQYTSVAFTEALIDAGITGSIGSVGDALDNALMESTIGLYKTEVIDFDARSWTGLGDVERATAEWVHWYNTARLHTSIGFLPPAEYEANYRASTATSTGAAA